MSRFKLHALAAVALLSLAAAPSWAGSSAASSVSESLSTSVNSISNSIKKSSDSSSKTTPLAAGDYRLLDVAELAEQPGMVRMHLQALADASEEGEFYLDLPQVAYQRSQVEVGAVVSARQHVYGLEFAAAATQQPFFLVVHDDWMRELQTLPVTI